ncbi:MAG: type II secretion system F family protein [Burkholderiaceae bacterium]
MGIFVYRAVDPQGTIVRGRLPAINSRELEARLQTSGLELLKSRPSRRGLLLRSRPPARELINFCLHMETTLIAGLMVTEALDDLVDSVENRGFRDVLAVILQAVREGTSFSASLASFPDVFSDVFVGMVRSGEESGQLGEAFAKLGENLRWQDELASQMKRMILYPAFTITVLLLVSIFILVYLVPELSTFIVSMSGGSLPWETWLLLKISEILRTYWIQLLIMPFLVGFGLWLSLRLGGGFAQRQIDAIKLSLPVVGPVIRKILLSRFCSLFGMLYESGLPIMQAMSVARDTLGNRAIAAAVDQAIREIEQGKGITDSFASSKLFPNLMLRMVKVGESTGEVGKGLRNVSYFYNRDIQQTIGRIQAMVEPTLTLALGIILAWLMMSVLGPIYDILSKVGV